MKRFRELLAINYAYMNEYRAELILWALSMSLSFILMGIWYEASGRGNVGISQHDVVQYFLCVFLARQFTVVYVLWDFEESIRLGKLSPQLLTPIDPMWRHVMSHAGERLARMPFVFILVMLFFAIYPKGFFIPSFLSILMFLIAVFCAFSLRFIIQYCVAMCCFWIERASAIETFHMLLYLFLSGAIAPLEAFPEPIRDVVMLTPFPYLIWFPAKALMGQLSAALFLRGIIIMCVWTLAFAVLNRILWRRGLRQYSSMGA